MWINLQIYRQFNGTGFRGDESLDESAKDAKVVAIKERYHFPVPCLSQILILRQNYLKYDHSPYLLLLCNARSSECLALTLGGPKSAVKLCPGE